MLGILTLVTVLAVVGKTAAIQIDVDYSAAPDLESFASKVRSTLVDWYPWLEEKLNSPDFVPVQRVSITFDPNYDGVAYATSGNRIVGGVNYYRSHQDDVGSMVHELVHVIQGYPNGCPGWVTEGIADYIRYYFYEPDRAPGKPGSGAHYTNGYGVTAYFLNYIVRRFNFSPDMVYWLNKDCREGQYRDDIWARLLDGNNPDQLWEEMMSPLKIEVDYTQAPELKDFGDKVQTELTTWYPILEIILDSPTFSPITYIKITFDPNYDGVAYAAGNQIVGSVQYYISHQDDLGSMIHEMIHVIQGYRNCPGWLTEGIADYWRYYFYDTDIVVAKPGPSNNYTDGYRATAYFLNYVQKTYGEMLHWLNKDCREGTYADSIWPELLGEGKTVGYLWDEMMTKGY